MANSYFESGQERANKVRILFDGIATRYDLINDVQSLGMHRWWKRRLMQECQLEAGGRVLDLCCGTGDLAMSWARKGFEVVAVDFSEPMLAVARQRAQAAGLAKIKFYQADVLELPFGDNEFDAVTMAYGLRNLADFEEGLRQMLRVVRPGGRVGVLDFGWPVNRAWKAGYRLYLRWAVPVFGRVFCGNANAYAYILESLEHYPAQRGVWELMQKLGYHEPGWHDLAGGIMGINYGSKH